MKAALKSGAGRRIGILSPCGTGNLGDEATVAVLISEIKRRYPSADIYGLTTNPGDTQQRHGIPAYPTRNISGTGGNARPSGTAQVERQAENNRASRQSATDVLKRIPVIYPALKLVRQVCLQVVEVAAEARFIARSFAHLRKTDLLIVAGSGQLLDNYYAVWGFPYTLLKWSVMAKACRTKLAFVSCGAGPIDASLSKIFIRWALKMGDYRSFRDRESRDLIAKIGGKADDPVVSDLVFGARLPGGPGRPKVVAINPIPNHDPRYAPKNSSVEYSSYLNRLASFIAWLIKNHYTVLLFPTQLRADPLVIADLKNILMKDPALNLEKYLRTEAGSTFDDVIQLISSADLVVASRFHGVLISFLLQKPVLGLSHHPKVSSLMRDMGQSDYLLNIDTFDLPTAIERFSAMESQSDAIRQQINSQLALNRQRLDSQYDELFAMVFDRTDVAESVPAKSPVLNQADRA